MSVYTCCICFETELLIDDTVIDHQGHAICTDCHPLIINYSECPYCKSIELLKDEHIVWKSIENDS